MARTINKLSVVLANKLSSPGYYGDGTGLWLLVSKTGSKSWVFRFTLAGRRREMGLGALHTVSLGLAREKAKQCRLILAEGKDPIEARDVSRTAKAVSAARLKLAADYQHMIEDGLFRLRQWDELLASASRMDVGGSLAAYP